MATVVSLEVGEITTDCIMCTHLWLRWIYVTLCHRWTYGQGWIMSEVMSKCVWYGTIVFQFTHHNHNVYTMPVAKQTIEHGRSLRYQSFNQYRKRFDLAPYQTFEELTGKTLNACLPCGVILYIPKGILISHHI